MNTNILRFVQAPVLEAKSPRTKARESYSKVTAKTFVCNQDGTISLQEDSVNWDQDKKNHYAE